MFESYLQAGQLLLLLALSLGGIVTAFILALIWAFPQNRESDPVEINEPELSPAISITPFVDFQTVSTSGYVPTFAADGMEIVTPERIQLAKNRISSKPRTGADIIDIEIVKQ